MALRRRRHLCWPQWGHGYWHHGYGYPGYGPYSPPPPPGWSARMTEEEEKEDLREYVAALKEELGAVEERLKELEKAK
jgi:hypothetical protein